MTAPEIDSLIVLFTPVDATTAPAIMKSIRDGVAAGRQAGATKKPVLSCVMAEPGRPAPLDADGERLPAFAFPENAAARPRPASQPTLNGARSRPRCTGGSTTSDGDAARAICRDAAERGAGWLSDDEVQRVLAAYKLPVATSVVTRSVEEAMAAARRSGFPSRSRSARRPLRTRPTSAASDSIVRTRRPCARRSPMRRRNAPDAARAGAADGDRRRRDDDGRRAGPPVRPARRVRSRRHPRRNSEGRASSASRR